MNFGEALEVLKHGGKVARTGWNGKGMWLLLVSAGQWALSDGSKLDCFPTREVREPKQLPWIGMRTAAGPFVPWLASQTDMLAEDWDRVGGE